MSLLDLILGRKKVKIEEPVKEQNKEELPKPEPPKPPEQHANTNGFGHKQATIVMSKQEEDVRKAVMIKEEPMITVAREIADVKYLLDDLKKSMTRDHHRMLDEFEKLPKSGDFAEILDKKLEGLKDKKEEIDKEIRTTELQKDILNVLSDKDMLSAAEIAEKLNKSRTWVSLQVTQLANQGVIGYERDGKHVKYKLTDKTKKEEPIILPQTEAPKPVAEKKEETAPKEELPRNGFNDDLPGVEDDYL